MRDSIIFLSLVSCSLLAQAGTVILEGKYKGENIFVQNYFTADSSSICTETITVNGKEIFFEKKSVFQIDLKSMNLKIGDPINIRITHRDDCKPKILLPELTVRNNFNLFTLKIDQDSLIEWSVVSGEEKNIYIIEQYRWNKWVKIGSVESKQGKDTALYNFNFGKYLHSGQNQLRIKMVDTMNVPHYSKPVKTRKKDEENILSQHCGALEIKFIRPILYEMYDQNGKLVKEGFGDSISINNLSKGIYFLNYDNKTTEFIKK